MTAATGLVFGYELPDEVLAGPVAGLLAAAARAEAAGVHHLLFGDRPAARPGRAGATAALVAASTTAVHTASIGLVVGAAPAYYEPYNLARMVSSLDHISRGRAGWQVLTGPDPEADANHGRSESDPTARSAAGRQARAAEFVPLLRDLWDTWEDGAFVHEKETGRFIDPGRVHVLDHVGPALRVRGPLNLARPPQGHPVIFASAADPAVADHADVLIAGSPAAVAADGGPGGTRPRLLRITPFVGATEALARELHDRAGAPDSEPDHHVVVGDADAVAEQLASWAGDGRFDGFQVRFPEPAGITAFTSLVLPLLPVAGRRGPGTGEATLRENLGLARPENGIVRRLASAAAGGGGQT